MLSWPFRPQTPNKTLRKFKSHRYPLLALDQSLKPMRWAANFVDFLGGRLNHLRYFFGMRFIDGVGSVFYHYPVAVRAVVVPFLKVGIDDLV